MVYSNKFVVCVLVNNQVQTELANGTVVIPFGTEYTLRFRNKNDRRAVVKFSIDGEDASGNGYIIPANDHVDIKRHADKDVAFKFVSLDSPDAVDAGKNGDNPDKTKGLIEAHFYLEKAKKIAQPIRRKKSRPNVEPTIYPYIQPYTNPNDCVEPYHPMWHQEDIRFSCCSADAEYSHIPKCSPIRLEGIQDGCTVEGSQTGQTFVTTWFRHEETCTTLRLFIQGYNPELQTFVPKPDLIRENQELKQKLEELQKNKIMEKENAELRKRIAELSGK